MEQFQLKEKQKFKIFHNIVPIIKVYTALFLIKPQQLGARKAREEGDFEKEREIIRTGCNKWGRFLMKHFGATVDVSGYENLPDKGPVVFVCNHQGYGDIPVLYSVIDKFQFGFLAKTDLSRLPGYSKWMKDFRTLFLERGNSREALKTINEAVDLLNNGFSILVFPEGTRSHGNPMRVFKKGSLKLATKAEVPVVPITLVNTYTYFEKQGYFKGNHAKMIIHEPIETKGMSRHEQNELPERTFWIIRNELNKYEPQPELPLDEDGNFQDPNAVKAATSGAEE